MGAHSASELLGQKLLGKDREIAALRTQLEEVTRERDKALAADGKTRPLFVWKDACGYLAVAHAHSVAEARNLLISEDHDCIGESGDGSCTERDKAREHVRNANPLIYYGSHAEFALKENANIIEMDAALEIAEKDRARLRDELKNTNAASEHLKALIEARESDVMEGLFDRNGLQCANCSAQIIARGGTLGEHGGLTPDEDRGLDRICGHCAGLELKDRDAEVEALKARAEAAEQFHKRIFKNASDCIEALELSGMGKQPGRGNCLVDMVRELIELRAKAEQRLAEFASHTYGDLPAPPVEMVRNKINVCKCMSAVSGYLEDYHPAGEPRFCSNCGKEIRWKD